MGRFHRLIPPPAFTERKDVFPSMITRRSAVSRARGFLAGLLAAAALLVAIPAPTHAENTTPPTAPPNGTTPPNGSGSSNGGTPAVESWALAPYGLNRPNLSYSAETGGVIHDKVTLINYGNVPLAFKVYATDAFNNDQGNFDILPAQQKPVDVGSWVSIPQTVFVVPARKQFTIPVTITIPKGATFGDHAGAIVASNQSIGVGPTGQAVQVDRRTGTRLYLRVNGKLNPKLVVSNLQADYHQSLNPFNGKAKISFRIDNIGNVRLSAADVVKISGPFGVGEKVRKLADVPELLPGQHLDITTEIDHVAALVLLSTTASLTPHGAVDLGTVGAVSTSDSTFAPPISLLIVLFVIVVLALVRRAIRRRNEPSSSQKAEPARREPQPV
ncbi:MAG: hypothetical protein WCI22_03090 [Actinomycetota bacterium]